MMAIKLAEDVISLRHGESQISLYTTHPALIDGLAENASDQIHQHFAVVTARCRDFVGHG